MWVSRSCTKYGRVAVAWVAGCALKCQPRRNADSGVPCSVALQKDPPPEGRVLVGVRAKERVDKGAQRVLQGRKFLRKQPIRWRTAAAGRLSWFKSASRRCLQAFEQRRKHGRTPGRGRGPVRVDVAKDLAAVWAGQLPKNSANPAIRSQRVTST